MEITVNIHGLDSLAQAIAAMAQAIERGRGGTLAAVAVPAASAHRTARSCGCTCNGCCGFRRSCAVGACSGCSG